jgi:hypothetical protein
MIAQKVLVEDRVSRKAGEMSCCCLRLSLTLGVYGGNGEALTEANMTVLLTSILVGYSGISGGSDGMGEEKPGRLLV